MFIISFFSHIYKHFFKMRAIITPEEAEALIAALPSLKVGLWRSYIKPTAASQTAASCVKAQSTRASTVS